MRNALRLRDHVQILGQPGKTVLVACDGVESPLACDGDCNERQITLESADGFQVGDGVSIQDARSAGGFTVTTGTLTARVDDHTFRLSSPLYLDYMVADKATARIAFPVIGGWGVRDATVADLTIEGNRDRRLPLDGCRGGGIYLFECEDVTIRGCAVRGYNGDGISFQVSQRVTVEGCTVENNAGLGIHPGSGSQHPVVKGNRSLGNGGDGLYVCWRVKYGVFEGNMMRGNGGAGISIGHKDTDNVFRDNRIESNRRTGVLFREEGDPMGVTGTCSRATGSWITERHETPSGRSASRSAATTETWSSGTTPLARPVRSRRRPWESCAMRTPRASDLRATTSWASPRRLHLAADRRESGSTEHRIDASCFPHRSGGGGGLPGRRHGPLPKPVVALGETLIQGRVSQG